jgi:hypothetical protein
MDENLRINDVTLLTLYSVQDHARGTLCVAEYDKHVPFEIKRIFYLYDLPKNVIRGQHAHLKQEQFIISLSGSIEFSTTYQKKKRKFTLSRPTEGIYFPPMTWIDIKILEVPAICLILSSGLYDESDYIRDYQVFEALADKA